MTEQVKDRWDSSFSWLRGPRTSKSHGCKKQESCSVSSVPWQGQSQPAPALPLTLQVVTEALTENTVIPQLFSTSSEPFPGPPLPRWLLHFRETSHLLYLFLLYKIHELKTLHISVFLSNSSSRNFPSLSALSFPGQGHSRDIEKQLHFFFFFKEEFHAFSMSKLQDSSSCHL